MNRQQGLSLVESMVALLVISIGLLGIAGLQINSMKQNNSALNHSQAVWFGYGIADRIRSNFTGFDDYAGIDTTKTYSQSCSATPCSVAKMVRADATDWQRQVQHLPSGRGIISINPKNTDQLDISVMWDDDGTGVTGTGCSGNTKTDLTCYRVVVTR